MKDLSIKEKYAKEVAPKLKEIFGYKNTLSAPKIEKIVVNIGLGRMSQNSNFAEKMLPEVIKDLGIITSQKPVTTLAKKSIAGFKIREGQTVGLKVTLRKAKMNDFLERLIKIILPRVRDFRGINLKNIDQKGNLSIGFKENIVFPEISADNVKVDFGLETTIVIKAKSRKEAIEFYRLMGIPLKKS